MKLRNKKTGRIFVVGDEIFISNDILGKIKLYWRSNGEDVIVFYNELSQFNEDWEDYKPSEPLIKDEKIRKAVRAWADASGIEKVLSYGGTFWLGFRSTNTESVWKFECNYVDASDFEDKEFSIEELCGKE